MNTVCVCRHYEIRHLSAISWEYIHVCILSFVLIKSETYPNPPRLLNWVICFEADDSTREMWLVRHVSDLPITVGFGNVESHISNKSKPKRPYRMNLAGTGIEPRHPSIFLCFFPGWIDDFSIDKRVYKIVAGNSPIKCVKFDFSERSLTL